ncbi:energy-coupling factor transporter transmembrane component T family protein [Azospirillum sp. ST 5-10]|uniref:energy-coupling factor transporter transmembrane component T family protein n=1 Tax=unclassified Azospirillum TaxID=2630922 RepID=UPI003F4A8367
MTAVPVLHTDRDSFLHRRDPRVKIGLFVLLVVFLYLAPSWPWMLGMTAVGVGLAVAARAPWRWLAVLLALQIPNVVGLVLIPAFGPLTSGSFAMTEELAFGLRLGLAWIAAILIGVSLLCTMDVDELMDGLRGVGLPKGFAFVVGYVFLLLYLSINDILRIADAMRLKGLGLSRRRPLRLLVNIPHLMIPALFTVVRRAQAMMSALDMRGFSFSGNTNARRTRLKFDLADGAALACGVLILASAGADRYGLVEPAALVDIAAAAVPS